MYSCFANSADLDQELMMMGNIWQQLLEAWIELLKTKDIEILNVLYAKMLPFMSKKCEGLLHNFAARHMNAVDLG